MEENPEQAGLLPPSRKIGSKSEYARHRGCAPSAVTRAIADRRISVLIINGKEVIDFAAADAAWASSTRFRRDATPPAPRGPTPVPDGLDAMGIARLKREEAAAELLALRLDREAGLLVLKADVDFVLADFGAMVRTSLEDMPARIAGALVGRAAADICRILDDEVVNILNNLVSKAEAAASGAAQQSRMAFDPPPIQSTDLDAHLSALDDRPEFPQG